MKRRTLFDGIQEMSAAICAVVGQLSTDMY
uniref:Uncharacterized protein n=1 Tax=Anguilla anguilla TaxID=7936 RepID=A0A0E9VIC5_ANGAN